MMMNNGLFTKDLGTILVGEEAVNEGIISEVGGLKEAMNKLNLLIDQGTHK
jgi:ATP-dependent protease ClpP protease subunit